MAAATPSTPPLPAARSASPSEATLSATLSSVFLDAARLCAVRLNADMAGIFEPLETEDGFRVSIAPAVLPPNTVAPTAQVIPAAGSMADYALTTGNVVVSPNLALETRFAETFLRSQGMCAALMLPLWSDDRVLCLMSVFRTQAQEFMLDEVWYLERIADALARLFEAAQQQSDSGGPAPFVSPDERLQVLEQLQSQVAAAEAHERQIAAALGSSPEDFRVSPRHDYPYYQKIAPMIDDQPPSWDDFVDVQCGDLSGGGISIWLSDKPSFRELVVALGRAPSLTHFAARVVYVREAIRAGRTMYQVGCQFLNRVYL